METIIQNNIIETIEKETGVKVDDKDLNLMSFKYALPEYTFLYIVDMLEKNFDYPISKILTKHDFTIFTINRLTREILSQMAA